MGSTKKLITHNPDALMGRDSDRSVGAHNSCCMPFGTILIDALANTLSLLGGFLPQLILTVIVLLVGGLLAFFLRRGVIWVFDQLQINKGGETIGLKEILERSGSYNLSGFFGWLVAWFFIIVAFLTAAQVLELTGVIAFLTPLGGYVVHVVTAALILLTGIVIANFLSALIRGSVKVARLVSANFLANAAWLAVFIFTLLTALQELQVPAPVLQYLVIGVIAALALASGIALGTGKDKGYFGKLLRDITE